MNSPCIKKCKLEDGVCIGCKRTIEQIKNWHTYTDLERIQIMEELKNPNTYGK